MWRGDETIWTSSGESQWLGWLRIAEQQGDHLGDLEHFVEGVRGRYAHVVLLGMGGSSLCPEVLSECLPKQDGFPELHVVDSTSPGQIRACEESVSIESTLFLSASKSGSTLETSLLTDYFLDRLTAMVGAERAASQFVAITDPGSGLEARARKLGFGLVMHGVPSIGGRYSALSHFGMVPAAAMGLGVRRLQEGARAMSEACGPDVPLRENPAFRLGVLLGAAANDARDKLTFVPSPRLAPLGAWIEQLVAESTGKDGKGIVPIDGEDLLDPSAYAHDRLFVRFSLASESEPGVDAALADLERLGHPVVRICLGGMEEIGQEFFRWEFATAVAGAMLGINPFDQPDVESAKVAAREITAAYEAEGWLPRPTPFIEDGGIAFFAGPEYARQLLGEARQRSAATVLRAHLHAVRAGDYLALQAFVDRNPASEAAFARMRASIRKTSRAATCIGFGPRFLHSTGQLHKGGPPSGVFLQISCDDAADLAVPGRSLSFGTVKDAQALGDFKVLSDLGRRALRVRIMGGLPDALDRLEKAVAQAVQ